MRVDRSSARKLPAPGPGVRAGQVGGRWKRAAGMECPVSPRHAKTAADRRVALGNLGSKSTAAYSDRP